MSESVAVTIVLRLLCSRVYGIVPPVLSQVLIFVDMDHTTLLSLATKLAAAGLGLSGAGLVQASAATILLSKSPLPIWLSRGGDHTVFATVWHGDSSVTSALHALAAPASSSLMSHSSPSKTTPHSVSCCCDSLLLLLALSLRVYSCDSGVKKAVF